MIVTTLQNGVAVGTATAAPEYASVLALAATTTSYCIQACLTMTSYDNNGSYPVVRFATCIDNIGASVASCKSLSRASGYVDCRLSSETFVTYSFSPVLSPKGLVLYVWVEDCTLLGSPTLTVKVIQYP